MSGTGLITEELLAAQTEASVAVLAQRLEDDDYASPFDGLGDWHLLRALASEQSLDDRPAAMRVAWTERQQLDGPGRWAVAYGIDCEGRRIRRLSAPLDLNAGSFAKQAPISGEAGFWYPERPFTLLSRLLQKACAPQR